MSKSPNAKPPKKSKPEEIKTEPGAWERFEHAVDAAVASGPKHRTVTSKIVPPKRPKPKDQGVKRRNSKEVKDK